MDLKSSGLFYTFFPHCCDFSFFFVNYYMLEIEYSNLNVWIACSDDKIYLLMNFL